MTGRCCGNPHRADRFSMMPWGPTATQNSQAALRARNAEGRRKRPLGRRRRAKPWRRGTATGRIGPPEAVCHPERQRGIFSNVIAVSQLLPISPEKSLVAAALGMTALQFLRPSALRAPSAPADSASLWTSISGSAFSSSPRAENRYDSASADAPAAVDRRREIAIHEDREEPIGPALVRAFARRVDLRHLPPHAHAILEHRHLEARDALVGNVDDVLRVMQERHVVVIGSEEQDLAVELDESLEERPVAEREVPRLRRHR